VCKCMCFLSSEQQNMCKPAMCCRCADSSSHPLSFSSFLPWRAGKQTTASTCVLLRQRPAGEMDGGEHLDARSVSH